MRRRSTKIEHVKRINRAVKLLKRFRLAQDAIGVLRKEHGISRPQAYRYVREAGRLGKPLRVPEENETVVVKLPMTICKKVRRLMRSGKGSISGIVAESLKVYLKRHGL